MKDYLSQGSWDYFFGDLNKSISQYFEKRGIQGELRRAISYMYDSVYDDADLTKLEGYVESLLEKAEQFNKNTQINPIDVDKFRRGYYNAEAMLENSFL